MLKNVAIIFFLLLSFSTVAQNASSNFKRTTDSLKQQDNFSEFIYVQLDEFAKYPSLENLTIFERISSNLWRNPSNKSENTAQLYYYINYAYNLKQFGFINQSIIQYEKAYAIYKKDTIEFDIIEFCLKPLANNYTRLGDIERAEDVLKITIEKAQKENNINQIVAGYSNLAVVFRTKGEYSQAINYLNLGLDLTTEKQVKSRIYSDLAINYLFLEEIQKTETNIQFSNQLNTQKNRAISTRNSITLGNCFVKKKEFENAFIHFENALTKAKVVFGKNDREVAKIHNQIAAIYKEQNQFQKGLNSYQEALSTLLPKYHPKTIFENPKATYFYPENTLKEALDGRALLFIQQNDFENALKNLELAFKVEDELRASFLTQNAKLIQQQENRNRSETCINLCYELYQKTNSIGWIEKAFQFAEESKSRLLLEAKESAFLKSNLKKDPLFVIEKELLFKKAQLNKSIAIEELKEETVSIKLLANFTKERESIFNKLQLLKQEIQTKYPSLKTKNNTLITFKNIEEKLLLNNESLIEFFEGKDNIYVFLISKGEPAKLEKIVKDEEFNSQISEFLNLFSDNRGTALQNNVTKYTSLGFQLYQKIFKNKLNKKIIIVPDGLFSFLPFDALITEETSITNFKKLPYLIKKNSISYAYSASILIHEMNAAKTIEENFIGFFPIFKNNHRGLSELNYTLQEAKSIENTRDGEFLLNSNASKKAFETLAKNYSIIHLSTHATSGDYYTPPAIEFYDETLYLPEIYGYNLQADLLVLSACETGIGTLRKGEGAMSLARGFSYAGVKNLLVSLWKVNDKSTEEIMAGFYKNHEQSGNKSEALHTSKLAYINNETISASKKSPYYWASFVYIGEVTSLENSNFNFSWFLIVGFVLIAGYILLKKR